jgi:hypothetical protein
VLERLKELFRPRRPVDVDYETEPKNTVPHVPVGPPTTPYPPVAPRDDPVENEDQ